MSPGLGNRRLSAKHGTPSHRLTYAIQNEQSSNKQTWEHGLGDCVNYSIVMRNIASSYSTPWLLPTDVSLGECLLTIKQSVLGLVFFLMIPNLIFYTFYFQCQYNHIEQIISNLA